MAEQRLPRVNGDDGTWGNSLLLFLSKEHYNDDTNNTANGGHQTITIRPGTTAAGTAPLKFLGGGALTTTAEAGAMEFVTDSLYFTITTGTNRRRVALYDDASGATGDTYYRNSSGLFTRLGLGTNGQQLTANTTTGLPYWADTTYNTSTQTSSYSVTSSDTVIFANASSAAVTITLPAATSFKGYRFYVKRIDASGNTVTIATTGGNTIDGATTQTLNLQYTALLVVSDGSAWYIL